MSTGWKELANIEVGKDADIIRQAAAIDPEFAKKVGLAAGAGEFTVSGLDVFARYGPLGGQRTAQVPAGKSFEIVLLATVKNSQWGWSDLTNWSTATTVYNETDKAPVGSDTKGTHGGDTGDVADAINAVMPNHAVTYRVKLWANQKMWAGAPPESMW